MQNLKEEAEENNKAHDKTKVDVSKRNQKEIEKIKEYLENEDFKITTWQKNTVFYIEKADCFQVELNLDF